MPKKKKQQIKHNWLYKLFRFFFPEDWHAEMHKGMLIGEQMQRGQLSPKIIPTWYLGKFIRKLVDPKHKMKRRSSTGGKE